ncbi:lipoprotein 17-related variable surface protein [Metamycoplasma hyosynoviae]|uniref:lipoprotein 17-related variable surface protein n=1 Tax=Metamycoplasma hyosynoviae TaxID=29559 RepID=UPI0023659103|nr:lipoprotein 17-related variable surface protein [Metamycoplasma hyosynoviae]MDD7837396.1 lipoprotein 17-related variable surface protein [Metamycoplasma hyosynoviae]
MKLKNKSLLIFGISSFISIVSIPILVSCKNNLNIEKDNKEVEKFPEYKPPRKNSSQEDIKEDSQEKNQKEIQETKPQEEQEQKLKETRGDNQKETSKLDFKNDLQIIFKKDKSSILPSQISSEIQILSKSRKTTYDYEILNFDDSQGNLEIRITPIHNGRSQETFDLTFSGFKSVSKTNLKDVVEKITNLDLKEKENKTIDEYLNKFPDLKSQLISLNSNETNFIQKYLNKNGIEVKTSIKEKSNDSTKAELQIQFKKDSETITKSFDISGFKKTLDLNDYVNELKDVSLKDIRNSTFANYKLVNKNLTAEKLKSNNPKIDSVEKYLTNNEIKIQIELIPNSEDSTKATLKIVFSKNNKFVERTYSIAGFVKDISLSEIIENLGELSLENTSGKTFEEYKNENLDLLSKIKSSNEQIKDLKKYFEENNINPIIELLKKENEPKSGMLNIKLSKNNGSSINKSFELKNIFVGDILSEAFDTILKEIQLSEADKKDSVEYRKDNENNLINQLVTKDKNNAQLIGELKKRNISLEKVEILDDFNFENGTYKLSITISKLNSTESQTKEINPINFFKKTSIQEIVEKHISNIDVDDKTITAKKWIEKYEKELPRNIKNYVFYSNKLNDYNIKITISSVSLDNEQNSVKLKLKYDLEKSLNKSFEKEYEIKGFKKYEYEPSSAEDAADKDLLIVVDKKHHEYKSDVERLKKWYKKYNKEGMLIYLSGSWQIRLNNTEPAEWINSLSFNNFDNNWKYSDVVKHPNDAKEKYARMYFQKEGEEIKKIIIRFRIAKEPNNKIYELEFWNKSNQ